MNILQRLLKLPEHSFFLFGPRGVGKSTWLRMVLPDALYLNLLQSSVFLDLTSNPERIEEMAKGRGPGSWIVIDEIQKAPVLLDEVHRLMEKGAWRFVLCGSSARKLRHGGVNLLAGRAVTRELDAFCSREFRDSFDMRRCMEWGCLPVVHNDPQAAVDILDAYVNTYLNEEIKQEGLVRNLAPFVRFLAIAGSLNGQVVNAAGVARDASVALSTINGYFSILVDTLFGRFLPAYRPRAKIREQAHPKFYWFDPGVARAVAGLLHDPLESAWLGYAFETLIYHELSVYNRISGKMRRIFFYRTGSGSEIDFIVETARPQFERKPRVVCIEAKLSSNWNQAWERAARSFAASEGVEVERMIGVYNGAYRLVRDGFEVFPAAEFLSELHDGTVF